MGLFKTESYSKRLLNPRLGLSDADAIAKVVAGIELAITQVKRLSSFGTADPIYVGAAIDVLTRATEEASEFYEKLTQTSQDTAAASPTQMKEERPHTAAASPTQMKEERPDSSTRLR